MASISLSVLESAPSRPAHPASHKRELMNSALKCLVLASALTLAACGGGGGDSPPPPPPPAAPSVQGFWSDDDSTTLITANGEVWTIEAADSEHYLLTRGTVTTNGSSFSGSLTSYLDPDNITATVTGSFVAGQSLSGTATAGGQSNAFAMTYEPSYAQAPSRAQAAGTWAIEGGSIVISQAGAFAMALGSCAVNGQLTPDSSGKNFFRLAATFSPACGAVSGAPVDGVVFADDTVVVTAIVSGEIGGAFVVDK